MRQDIDFIFTKVRIFVTILLLELIKNICRMNKVSWWSCVLLFCSPKLSINHTWHIAKAGRIGRLWQMLTEPRWTKDYWEKKQLIKKQAISKKNEGKKKAKKRREKGPFVDEPSFELFLFCGLGTHLYQSVCKYREYTSLL